MPPSELPDAAVPNARTYLVWSLGATVLCFLPMGLVALYFGLRVSRAVASGATEDAARLSRAARRWLIATVVVGVAIYAVIVIVFALLGAFSQ